MFHSRGKGGEWQIVVTGSGIFRTRDSLKSMSKEYSQIPTEIDSSIVIINTKIKIINK